MSDIVPMTVEGKKRLEGELLRLKTQERPSVIKSIAIAREHGDLKENAEYHAAREKQSFLEGKIQYIEDQIARADVIDPKSIQSDKIMFGATVVLQTEEGDIKKYQIVGDPEADLKEGRLSIASPLVRAMLGKREGDEVVIKNAKGEKSYEVQSVEYK